jgi:hypothetical protein
MEFRLRGVAIRELVSTKNYLYGEKSVSIPYTEQHAMQSDGHQGNSSFL